MKVVFHEDFYQVYTFDPAAAAGRMEAVLLPLLLGAILLAARRSPISSAVCLALAAWVGWSCRRSPATPREFFERALWIVAVLFLMSPT